MTTTDAASGKQHKHGLSQVDPLITDRPTKDAVAASIAAAMAAHVAEYHPTPEPTPPPVIEPAPVPTGPVFYVATNGSDADDGSQLRPWASIQRFMDAKPAPGSTLLLRGGNYPQSRGGTTASDKGLLVGTADAPITIRNAPGEVVQFPDVTAPVLKFQGLTPRAAYVVLDGIDFPNVKLYDAAAIVIGGLQVKSYLTHHITIRNCSGSLAATSKSVDHIIGLIAGCADVTIEGFTGEGTAGQGDAIVIYDSPAALRTVIRDSVFTDFPLLAVQVWDYAPPTASLAVEACDFRRGVTALDLCHHGPSSVTDCTFDVPEGPKAIYDPNYSSLTAKSGNRYSVA